MFAGRGHGFKRAPKRLDHSVVIAVGFAAHALGKPRVHKRLAVFARRILDSAIRVMDEPRRRAAALESPPQRLQAKPGGQGRAASPTDNPAAVGIHHCGHREPAFVGWNVGDVGAPNFVNGLGWSAVLEQIWGDGIIVIAVGGAGVATLAAAAASCARGPRVQC